MKINRIHCVDALKGLRAQPDESIDMVMTSPPYWALRDYKVEGQLGLEPTFELFIKNLCNIFDEVKRVLTKTGTCWVNFGDTYGGGIGHSDFTNVKRYTGGGDWKREPFKSDVKKPMQKSLLMIPERFAIEMINRGWILRNQIIWHKPNVMPSSARDRFSVDFEKLFFFVKSKKYYFKQQLEPHKSYDPRYINHDGRFEFGKKKSRGLIKGDSNIGQQQYHSSFISYTEGGRNKRTVWKIPVSSSPEVHFATYPDKLCETPIKAGSPKEKCSACGMPKLTRITGGKSDAFNIRVRDVKHERIKHTDRRASKQEVKNYNGEYESPEKIENVFKCDCNKGYSPGLVLDPFCGTGTTCLVAKKLGRRFIGFDINPEYVKMAQIRTNTYEGGPLVQYMKK